MGTVINAAAVIIGGTIGMLVKGGLPLRVRDLLMRSLGPVSYTHLDVYKRQDINKGGAIS